MSTDPMSTLINTADTPEAWCEAAMLVRSRVSTGQADATLIHHLMVKGWRVLDTWCSTDHYKASRGARSATVEITLRTSEMAAHMVAVLDQAVGQSTV